MPIDVIRTAQLPSTDNRVGLKILVQRGSVCVYGCVCARCHVGLGGGVLCVCKSLGAEGSGVFVAFEERMGEKHRFSFPCLYLLSLKGVLDWDKTGNGGKHLDD